MFGFCGMHTVFETRNYFGVEAGTVPPGTPLCTPEYPFTKQLEPYSVSAVREKTVFTRASHDRCQPRNLPVVPRPTTRNRQKNIRRGRDLCGGCAVHPVMAQLLLHQTPT